MVCRYNCPHTLPPGEVTATACQSSPWALSGHCPGVMTRNRLELSLS